MWHNNIGFSSCNVTKEHNPFYQLFERVTSRIMTDNDCRKVFKIKMELIQYCYFCLAFKSVLNGQKYPKTYSSTYGCGMGGLERKILFFSPTFPFSLLTNDSSDF